MLKHVLVPKHEVLNAKDAEEVLNKYGATPSELPKIKEGDPAIGGVKINVGDIIKITRDSPTAGKAIYYRVVIED